MKNYKITKILNRLIVLVLSMNVFGCGSDPSEWKPGQILSEKSTRLGHGYRMIARSVVNPVDHWEAVGHFVYIYYKDTYLCHCSDYEVVISPDGRYAIYADDETGRLKLFKSRERLFSELSAEYVGYPYKADWDIDNDKATVYLKKWLDKKQEFQMSEITIDMAK